MDLAKVDSLFMLLILAAFYTSRAQSGVIMAVISGVLFALAFFTKQLALPVILIFAPYLDGHLPRKNLAYLAHCIHSGDQCLVDHGLFQPRVVLVLYTLKPSPDIPWFQAG